VQEPFETTKWSDIDLKQRHPFLTFYLAAAAFSGTIVLAGRTHSYWQVVARMLALLMGAFAVWSFYRLFSLTDERQRQTNEQALRFAFLATVVLSLLAGLVRGFGSPIISCGAILT
jgi:4-amino-4-deoxy-L-arabinose transferase-like glycosyltransferase